MRINGYSEFRQPALDCGIPSGRQGKQGHGVIRQTMTSYGTHFYSILSATLFWLAALTFIAGLLMAVIPGWLMRVSGRLNVWVETSAWFRKLDEQRHFERFFYRHHLLMGVLIVAGSLYSLGFIWRLQGSELLVLLPALDNPVLLDILQAALGYLLLLGNVFAFVIGVVVLVRPSLLKGVEGWSNRWVDSEPALRSMDRHVDFAERVIPGHPRLFGLLVMIGSLYIMSNTLFSVLPG